MKFSLIVFGLLVVGYAHWSCTSRPAAQVREDSPLAARQRMVEEQIKARGIKDEGVLAAMLKVPRERFVPSGVAPLAYADRPLPIGYGQTISQPYIVAFMTEALQVTNNKKVLEIGTGSGYQAAVLGELAREVYTIEIVPQLADRARDTLAALGYRNVHVRTGDGYLGWPEQAPFDAIMVTAAPDHVPQPLVDQLGLDGRMIIPVGVIYQDILLVSRTPTGIIQQRTIPARFAPLVRPPRQVRRLVPTSPTGETRDDLKLAFGRFVEPLEHQQVTCKMAFVSVGARLRASMAWAVGKMSNSMWRRMASSFTSSITGKAPVPVPTTRRRHFQGIFSSTESGV